MPIASIGVRAVVVPSCRRDAKRGLQCNLDGFAQLKLESVSVTHCRPVKIFLLKNGDFCPGNLVIFSEEIGKTDEILRPHTSTLQQILSGEGL